MGYINLKNETVPLNFKDEIAKQNGHLIGLVIGFRYKDKNNRTLQHKADFVSLLSQNPEKKNMIVLAIWYSCSENSVLNQIIGNF